MRRLWRWLRENLIQTLIMLVVLEGILVGIGVVRYVNLSNGLIANQQATCRTGNEVRAHIRTVTKTLRDLIDVSLAIPEGRYLTPRELAARGKLIITFSHASQALTRRLEVLAPRDCSRGAVTSAPDEPGEPG